MKIIHKLFFLIFYDHSSNRLLRPYRKHLNYPMDYFYCTAVHRYLAKSCDSVSISLFDRVSNIIKLFADGLPVVLIILIKGKKKELDGIILYALLRS